MGFKNSKMAKESVSNRSELTRDQKETTTVQMHPGHPIANLAKTIHKTSTSRFCNNSQRTVGIQQSCYNIP